MPKSNLLRNYKYALLDTTAQHYILIQTDEELNRMVEDGSISDGDIVVELKEENTKVATLQNFIKLK